MTPVTMIRTPFSFFLPDPSFYSTPVLDPSYLMYVLDCLRSSNLYDMTSRSRLTLALKAVG